MKLLAIFLGFHKIRVKIVGWRLGLSGLHRLEVAAFFIVSIVGVCARAAAQFETRSSTLGAGYASSAAVGDFDRDGKLDFAVAANNLQVFLGNGDGTFQPPLNYLTGTGALFVATADLNHDGKLDLAVADLNGLFVLMGNGDGTFQAPVTYAVSCTPIFVTTGDFRGDGKLDLLVTYSSGNCPYVSIFLGNGDGTFQEPPIDTNPSYSPAATEIGDFNGDGNLDLAIAEQFGGVNQVEILLGKGDGSFSSGASYPVGSDPLSIAVADFRGNGKLDLAVATLYGGTSVLLGNGDGTFSVDGGFPTPDADWVVSADFNGDGKPDLAVATEGIAGVPPGVNVALGNGDGTFQSPTFYPAGENDRYVASGDFNGDRKVDLLVPDYSGNAYLLLNTGVVSFSPTTPLNFPSQLVGTTSEPQTVKLTNTASTALTVSSLKVAGPFRESNTCGKSVAAGAQCEIKVIFKPQRAGNAAGTVTIEDSASSKPQFIELAGAGTVMQLTPAKLTFPSQKVGTRSAPQNVTLANQGSTAVSVSQVYVGGNNYKDFSQTNNCPTTLGAGASCTIAVTFDPKKTGTRTADVGALDTGGGSPQSIPISGTGD
jgi:hypothetical protein